MIDDEAIIESIISEYLKVDTERRICYFIAGNKEISVSREKIANLPDMIKEWVERYSKLGAKKRMECLLFAHSIKYSEIMQKLLRSGMVSEEKLDERLSQFPSYKEVLEQYKKLDNDNNMKHIYAMYIAIEVHKHKDEEPKEVILRLLKEGTVPVEYFLKEEYLNIYDVIIAYKTNTINTNDLIRICEEVKKSGISIKSDAEEFMNILIMCKYGQLNESGELEVNIDNILKFCKLGILNPEIIVGILDPEDINTALKNTSFLKSLSEDTIKKIWAQGYLMETKNDRIKKMISGINGEEFISFIEKGYMNKKVLIPLLKKMPKDKRPTSDQLYNLFSEEPLSGEFAEKLHIGCDENKCLTGKEILSLVEEGFIEPKRLIDVYNRQKSLHECVVARGTEAAFTEDIIFDKDYLQYFSLDRLLPILQDEENAERFKEMYFEIVSRQKDRIEYEKLLVENYLKNSKDNSNDNLKILLKEGILSLESVIPYVNKESLLDIYKEYGIELKKVLPYLGSEEIQELYIDGEITINEIAKGLAKGDISRDTFGELMSNSEVGEYLKDGEISSETILDSYLIGKLSVEDLKQIGIDNLILKDMGEYSFPEGERIQHIKKIEELILSKALSYDNLESLREQGILSSDEFSKICDSRANQQAIEEIKALPEILNTGETLGESSIRTQESTTITKNQRYQISPEIIDEFLDKLGKNNVTRREISGGALDGYTLVLLENMRVVVLEKINTKRGENNATYVLPLIKAVELAEQSNKSELRTEENVEVVNHVRNYGTNLMRKIGMLQEKTISRDNRNVTWIKALPEGHQDEANKMIAQIQENYDENRGR